VQLHALHGNGGLLVGNASKQRLCFVMCSSLVPNPLHNAVLGTHIVVTTALCLCAPLQAFLQGWWRG
jgi:hypothetical protein